MYECLCVCMCVCVYVGRQWIWLIWTAIQLSIDIALKTLYDSVVMVEEEKEDMRERI